jgi:hypothetical protein
MNAIFSTGDFNGDGKGDVLARRADTGALWLYPGNGSGGWLQWTQIGTGWEPGLRWPGRVTLDGDAKSDVVGRIGDTLWLYPGHRERSVQHRAAISLGTGWQALKDHRLASPMDLARVGVFPQTLRLASAALKYDDGPVPSVGKVPGRRRG